MWSFILTSDNFAIADEIILKLQVDISKVSALCCLLGALLSEPGDRFSDKAAVKVYIAHCFIFCYVWNIGGNILETNRKPFEELIKRQFEVFEEAE